VLAFSEACERNKDPILGVLRSRFADRNLVFEVGSGTGQHAVHFARHLPNLIWQPSEREENLPDLKQRVAHEGGANLREPVSFDVCQRDWPSDCDAIFTANTLHIMPFTSVVEFFRGAGGALAAGGIIAIYGPFRYSGRYTSESNREFDGFLRARDPLSGIRDIDELSALGKRHSLELDADHDLPANNRLLVYVKHLAAVINDC